MASEEEIFDTYLEDFEQQITDTTAFNVTFSGEDFIESFFDDTQDYKLLEKDRRYAVSLFAAEQGYTDMRLWYRGESETYTGHGVYLRIPITMTVLGEETGLDYSHRIFSGRIFKDEESQELLFEITETPLNKGKHNEWQQDFNDFQEFFAFTLARGGIRDLRDEG